MNTIIERVEPFEVNEYSFPPAETCSACAEEHEIVRVCYACHALVCRACACDVEGSTGDVACPSCEAAYKSVAPATAIFRLDDETDTTLPELIAVNEECPLDDEELDAIRELHVGEGMWLGCGGGATRLERVA